MGDPGSIPGWGSSPGGGHGNPLQYSCLENPMDRGAYQATVHGVTKSWTWLSDWAQGPRLQGAEARVRSACPSSAQVLGRATTGRRSSGAAEAAWVVCSPLNGAVCRHRVQLPALASNLRNGVGVWPFGIFLFAICPNCTHTQLFFSHVWLLCILVLKETFLQVQATAVKCP